MFYKLDVLSRSTNAEASWLLCKHKKPCDLWDKGIKQKPLCRNRRTTLCLFKFWVKKRSTIPWSSWLLGKEFESEAEEDGEQGEAERETDLLMVIMMLVVVVMMTMMVMMVMMTMMVVVMVMMVVVIIVKQRRMVSKERPSERPFVNLQFIFLMLGFCL